MGKIVSVIIPVYNIKQRYLLKCLHSIRKQTYKHLEIICVNDASSNNSLDVLIKEAQKDIRIKIIDKKNNEGVDKARFTGLNSSSGEYVMFIDADDYLLKADAISCMYNVAEKLNVDYVSTGSQRVITSIRGGGHLPK